MESNIIYIEDTAYHDMINEHHGGPGIVWTHQDLLNLEHVMGVIYQAVINSGDTRWYKFEVTDTKKFQHHVLKYGLKYNTQHPCHDSVD